MNGMQAKKYSSQNKNTLKINVKMNLESFWAKFYIVIILTS